MADKHPYASPGAITAAVNQFRKVFPSTIGADTLRKLSIAPQNESYVLNTLRFIGAINEEGAKTDAAATVFTKHPDAEFQKAFAEMVKTAYTELFNLHGNGTWELSYDELLAFFRNNDQTSEAVGRKQASTFQALAALAGHGEVAAPAKPKVKEAKTKNDKPAKQPKPAIVEIPATQSEHGGNGGQPGARDFGLTVRIEVNLPAAADQDTYDKIFRSIRENLLNVPK